MVAGLLVRADLHTPRAQTCKSLVLGIADSGLGSSCCSPICPLFVTALVPHMHVLACEQSNETYLFHPVLEPVATPPS